jgi:hypothetical protein
MANIFKLAKQIQRKHPRMDWQDAIQAAKKKNRSSGRKVGAVKKKKRTIRKEGSNRQTGSSNNALDRQRNARPPGARIPAGGKSVTYYERRKNRSDKTHSLTGVSAGTLKSELKKRLKQREDKLVLQKYRATRKTDKRRIGKEITAVKRDIRKIL